MVGDLGYLQDHHDFFGQTGDPIPVRFTMNDQIVGCLGPMRAVGLNIVQDPELGSYVEIELEEV